MKANELRIGNYINVPETKQCPFRIDLFDYVTNGIGKFGQIISKDIHPLTWYLQDLSPIPLTEEWLLKFGFYFDLKTDYDGYWKKYKEGFEIRIYKFEDYFEYGWQLGHDPIKIKYVHQLQNLYFSLTGEELTIH